MTLMIKKIAWETFKNTGDIDTFLEFKQIENIENNIKEEQKIISQRYDWILTADRLYEYLM